MKKNNDPQIVVISVEHFERLVSLARSAEVIIAGENMGNDDPTVAIRRHVRRFNPTYQDGLLQRHLEEKRDRKKQLKCAKTLLDCQSRNPTHVFYLYYEDYLIPVKSLGKSIDHWGTFDGWLNFQLVDEELAFHHYEDHPAEWIFIQLPPEAKEITEGDFKGCYTYKPEQKNITQ